MNYSNISFLTIGSDCSPASTLRTIGLRNFALPFDWVRSTEGAIYKCLSDDFKSYHRGLRIAKAGSSVEDAYGFQFPHDYPHSDDENMYKVEDIITEKTGIVSNWTDYTLAIVAKYERRIERFRNIVADRSKPIIVLCRYNIVSARRIHALLMKLYDRTDIYMVNACKLFVDGGNIIHIAPEHCGKWNDADIWKMGITSVKKRIHKK